MGKEFIFELRFGFFVTQDKLWWFDTPLKLNHIWAGTGIDLPCPGVSKTYIACGYGTCAGYSQDEEKFWLLVVYIVSLNPINLISDFIWFWAWQYVEPKQIIYMENCIAALCLWYVNCDFWCLRCHQVAMFAC